MHDQNGEPVPPLSCRTQPEWQSEGIAPGAFHIMNYVNASTGFSSFQLHIGCSPHMLPPLSEQADKDVDTIDATSFLSRLELDVLEAQDNLMAAKAQQVQVRIGITSLTPSLRSETR